MMKDYAKSIVLYSKRRPKGNQKKVERLQREMPWHMICYSPRDG
jgi:hypothetical protein